MNGIRHTVNSRRVRWKEFWESDHMGGGDWLRRFIISHVALVGGAHGLLTLPTKAASFAVFAFGAVTTALVWVLAVRQWRRLRSKELRGDGDTSPTAS